MSFIRSYLERQVDEPEYFHWMRQFVGIFKCLDISMSTSRCF